MKWYLSKIDIKGAFLQSGKAQRDVYVHPPCECTQKDLYWLLDVATYGLVNANAKWEWHSDHTFGDLGLSVVHIPQLFYMISNGYLVLIAAKVTDDILVGGSETHRHDFVKKLSLRYKLGTVVHMPGSFLFFGLKVDQKDNGEIHLSSEQKLNDISTYASQISPQRI